MLDPVRELKVRAEVLHHLLTDTHTIELSALERLRVLPEHRKATPEALAQAAPTLQRKHCLAVVGREAGFSGWEHAKRVLEGDAAEADFGKLLYGAGRSAFLNHWLASYDEARAVHADLLAAGERRYLLAYQKQFFISEADYIESLGLDPNDPDWTAIGWDWVKPRSMAARARLYAKLLTPRA